MGIRDLVKTQRVSTKVNNISNCRFQQNDDKIPYFIIYKNKSNINNEKDNKNIATLCEKIK